MKKILNKIHTRTWVGFGILILLLPIVLLAMFRPLDSEASWYSENWAWRKPVTFTHNANVTNTKVLVEIDTETLINENKMQADCGDVRFTDVTGNLLAYYYDTGADTCDTASTDYYVLIPSIVSGSNTLYLYYGNPSVINGTQQAQFSQATTTPSGGSPSSGTEEKGPGPIGYWAFDEGYGSAVNDAGSGDDDGTITNATWQAEDLCVSGKCLRFDGTGDYVDIGNKVGPQTGMSVSFWVRPNANNITQVFVSQYDATNAYMQFTGSNDNIIFRIHQARDTIFIGRTATGDLEANKWQYLTATWSGAQSSSSIAIYKNGVRVDDSNNELGTFTAPYSGSVNLKFGAQATSGSPVNGFMDEIKIYDYAQTEAQIKANYNEGAVNVGGNTQRMFSDGLVGYWKMDEASWTNNCSTESVLDSSGNNNDGASCPNSTGPVGGGQGKFGKAGDFDGSDDYVNVPYSSSFDIPDTITLAAWVYSDGTSGGNTAFIRKDGAYRIEYANNGFIIGRAHDCTGAVSQSTLPTGVWTHIAWTYNETVNTLYINGVENSISTENCSLPTGTSDIQIGTHDDEFNGRVDEARVYNRVLDGKEIRQLYNLAPGPLAHFKFDENTGSNAYDTSGNGYATTVTNSPTWQPGKYGSSLRFLSSSSQYVNVDSLASPLTSGDMSVSLWFNPTSTFTSGAANDEMLFSLSSSSSANDFRLFLVAANGVMRLRINSTNADTSQTSWTANTWYHVHASFSTTEGMKIYINGVLSATNANTTRSGTAATNVNIARQSTSTLYFNGRIDDVRVYNYTRNTEQIVEDINGGHPLGGSPIASQVAYWKFDEQQGTIVNNSVSTVSLTSAISGATWETDVDCKINGCLRFDGTDDVVTITNSTAIDLNDTLSTGFTITGWVNPDTVGENSAGHIFVKSNTTFCVLGGSTPFNLTCSLDLATDATVTVNSVIPSGEWTHFALTWADDDDDEITVWINGLPVGTSTNGVGPTSAESSNLLIGGGAANNFDGYIDEFKVYSDVLSLESILVDMNANASINIGVGAEPEINQLVDGAGTPPIGYWTNDENTDNTCTGGTNDLCDISGNGNDGAKNGMSAYNWLPGKYGTALSYDGSDDYVNFGNPSTFDFGVDEDFSISLWVKAIDNGTAGGIIGKANGNMGVSGVTGFDINYNGGSNNTAFRINNGSGSAIGASFTTPNLGDNTWHHLVATADRDGNSVIYLDGIARTTSDISSKNSDLTVTNNLVAGRRADGANSQHFPGQIDEIKVYDRVLTPSQVMYEYNRGAAVGWWKLDECQGSTIYDASGKGNNGTVTIGGSGTQTSVGTCETSSTAWGNGASGKYNSSINLDGTDDYVQITDSDSTYHLTGDLSYGGWFKSTDTGQEVLISKGTTSDWLYSVFLDSGPINCKIYQAASTSAYLQAISVHSVNDGEWHHVMCVLSGNTIYTYVDGKLSNSSSSTSGSRDTSSAGPLYIGTFYNTAPNLHWPGQLDDIKIFNYALSGAQVRKVHNEGAAVRFGP